MKNSNNELSLNLVVNKNITKVTKARKAARDIVSYNVTNLGRQSIAEMFSIDIEVASLALYYIKREKDKKQDSWKDGFMALTDEDISGGDQFKVGSSFVTANFAISNMIEQ